MAVAESMVYLHRDSGDLAGSGADQQDLPGPAVRVAPLREEHVDHAAQRAGNAGIADEHVADALGVVGIRVGDPAWAPPPAPRGTEAPAQFGNPEHPLPYGGPELGDIQRAGLQQQHRADLLAQEPRLRVQEQRILRPQRHLPGAAHGAVPSASSWAWRPRLSSRCMALPAQKARPAAIRRSRPCPGAVSVRSELSSSRSSEAKSESPSSAMYRAPSVPCPGIGR